MRGSVWRQFRCRHHDCFNTLQLSHSGVYCWRPRVISHFVSTRPFNSVSSNLRSDPTFFSTELDVGFPEDRQYRTDILTRARAHGIDTLDRLTFEADLAPVRQSGTRLLEDDSIRQDLDLWAIVLDYRKVKDGSSGVKDVISAMLHAGAPVRLYEDAVSQHIWQTILPVALSNEKLLYELCQTGSSFMRNRPEIFGDIVGQLFARGNIRLSITFATQYLSTYFRGIPDLLHLFNIAFQLESNVAINNFCRLMARLPRYHIYDQTIPKLWMAERKQQAFLLHRHLLSLGDYPTDFEQIEPFILEIAAANLPFEPFLAEMAACGISYSHQARRVYKRERSRLLQALGGLVKTKFAAGPGMRPVKLSDAFVARTLATKSVSFDFVLSGLRFIGLFEIGPQAVRELALAAKTLQKLQDCFRKLDDMEVDLGSTNYVRVIKNLCQSGEEKLLQSIVDSDMHHEVFEDIQMQRRMLVEYSRHSKWPEYDRTLAILAGGTTTGKAAQHAAQQVLMTTLIEGDWRKPVLCLDEMRNAIQKDAVLSEPAPIRLALRRVWAQADLQSRTNTEYLHRYLYLVSFMQHAQSAGLQVTWWQWRSTLHAVGRSGNWDLFECLVLTMSRMYHRESQALSRDTVLRDSGRKPLLDELFDEGTQSLILEVSLTAETGKSTPQDLWLRGVRLLRILAHRFGVDINYEGVSTAFGSRLRRLFSGTDSGTQRRFIGHYLGCINWAWLESNAGPQTKLPHAVYQRGISKPEWASLRLLQLRLRLVRRRRHQVGPALTGDRVQEGDAGVDGFEVIEEEERVQASLKHQSDNLETTPLVAEIEPHDNGTVFYTDLLHPSYNRSAGTQQK